MTQTQVRSRFKKISVVLAASVIVVGGGVLTSSTASAKKGSTATPQAPTVISIESKLAKNKRKANVIVTFALPTNVTKKSIQLTEVNADHLKCLAKKAKTTCTFKNVDARMRFGITLKTKANGKFSKSTKRIYFGVNSLNRKWLNPSSRQLLAPAVNRGLAGVLKSSGGKVTNLQGVQRRARASSMSMLRPAVVATQSSTRFTLNVSNAVAFAQPEGSTSNSSSGLVAISATGEVSEAITMHEITDSNGFVIPISTPIRVSKFYTGPDGQIYLLLVYQVQYSSTPESCVFFRVSQDTGIPTCLDKNLTGMHWYGGWMSQRYTNPGVQFDAAGNVYYMGYNASIGAMSTVLRKYDIVTGVITDLVTENTRIDDFAVLPNGAAIIVGNTTSTGQQWTRVVGGGGVRSLTGALNGVSARFVAKFADGNYYLGRFASVGPTSTVANGVVRYNVSSGQLETKYWISAPRWGTNGQAVTSDSYNILSVVCLDSNGNIQYSNQICQNGGAGVTQIATAGGKTFAVNQSAPGEDAVLMEYYPTVKEVPLSIKKVTLLVAAGSKAVIAGTNTDGVNVMSIYDPSTGVETVVMDGTTETEMYSMSYVPATNKVMFSGLQFATNSFVVGEINIS
jgi:hypothetical protein